MSYTRVTEEERRLIHEWRQAGKSVREMARLLQRTASTICREVPRNTGGKGYRPEQAQELAEERARRPGPRRFTEEVRLDAEEKLGKGWTPEIICGRAKLEGRPHVCKETICKHVHADAKAGGELWKNLPRAKRKRKRRCPRQEGRGRGVIPGRRGIGTRPPEVELRSTVGHWEGDLVVGAHATGYLVTLVERVTRYTPAGWSATKEAGEVGSVVTGLLAAIGVACTGITFDNGKEFARHAGIAAALKADVFFARPCHSWERGTNENTNGLIRRWYPKSESFAAIGEADPRRIDTFLNDRPRKCLGWKTPREVMGAFLAAAA